ELTQLHVGLSEISPLNKRTTANAQRTSRPDLTPASIQIGKFCALFAACLTIYRQTDRVKNPALRGLGSLRRFRRHACFSRRKQKPSLHVLWVFCKTSNS